jgi:transcriptional regulator with XRE-family HTH domain
MQIANPHFREMLYNIKKIRELKNLSQEQMVVELGIDQSTYSKIESGEVDLGLRKLEKILAFLKIELIDLLHFDTKNIIHNFGKSRNNTSTQNFYNSPSFSPTEKALYEKCIENLEKENAFLREMLAKK